MAHDTKIVNIFTIQIEIV